MLPADRAITPDRHRQHGSADETNHHSMKKVSRRKFSVSGITRQAAEPIHLAAYWRQERDEMRSARSSPPRSFDGVPLPRMNPDHEEEDT